MKNLTKNRPKIACVIPALNEEPTVGQVTKIAKQSPYIDEVIVVSSGSTDDTAKIARQYGATVYEPPANGSKGNSMLYGVSKTDAPIILFLDADLLKLQISHIKTLVLPVALGKKDMIVGINDRGSILTPITKHLPLISGQRALERDIIENINPKYLQGYMVETTLNFYCRKYNRTYSAVTLKGLRVRRKIQKVGYTKGCLEYVLMGWQILKAMFFIRFAFWRNKF